VLNIKTQSFVELGCLLPVNCVNFSDEPSICGTSIKTSFLTPISTLASTFLSIAAGVKSSK
jgi:hypothetical protein